MKSNTFNIFSNNSAFSKLVKKDDGEASNLIFWDFSKNDLIEVSFSEIEWKEKNWMEDGRGLEEIRETPNLDSKRKKIKGKMWQLIVLT